ncbi:MAG: hypothetical protein V1903_06940 [Bacteroidota bacterium]
MKKRNLIFVVVFLMAAGTSFQGVEAQEKSKEEKEIQMEEAIKEQKKAMADQKKAQEELQKVMQEHQSQIDEAMKNYRVIWEDSNQFNRAFRIYEDFGRNRSYWNGESFEGRREPFIVTPGVDVFAHFNGDSERTSWDFSKNIKESGFSREYLFDVESTVNTVVMSVNGDCKVGEIRIKIVMPNGKTYSDIIIDEFGNLNWRKSFTISDTENQDKVGAWKFEINSSKATGYFKISLQTY